VPIQRPGAKKSSGNRLCGVPRTDVSLWGIGPACTGERRAREAWEAHEGDYTRIEAAHATLRHLVREVRQADAVTSISLASDNSGQLGLLMPGAETRLWEHDDPTDIVNFTSTAGSGMLADNITGLRLTGYKADGTTTTTVPAEVQFLKIEVTVELPREVNGTRVVSSFVWLRSW
jgi:hypothetical protein